MSTTLNTVTLKRFSYDWIRRFIELLPSDRRNFRYQHISPAFNFLLKKYIDHKFGKNIYIKYKNHLDNATIRSLSNVVITDQITFLNCGPGVIDRFFTSPKIKTCRLLNLNLLSCRITPDELMKILNFTYVKYEEIFLEGTITERVSVSSIIPEIRPEPKYKFCLENLIDDQDEYI
uniref:F-box domain-containing protein n=1 Tax=Panagrellus redivivus TaxID=6233 RepID=A0A7E5A0D9_PANRE